jgi:hypothetical protein
VVRRILGFCREQAWGVAGVMASPISGADGNREFLAHVVPHSTGLSAEDLDRETDAALISPIGPEVAR